MVEMICGDLLYKLDDDLREKIKRRVEEYIEEATGVQTIVQMEGLRSMVDEYNIVDKKDRKTPMEYKKIYNQRLMEIVNERINQLKRGKLSVEDLTIKGSLEFIKKIYKQGFRLYLTSGTDREDVINEATVLKVASYFEGRIYGAIGTIEDYSKEQVVKEIIDSNNLQGHQLACIGDGVVEIEKVKEKGGITFCVASDEKRRQGLNEWKRKRGILHGADFIMPDFTEWKKILKLLTSCRSLKETKQGNFYIKN